MTWAAATGKIESFTRRTERKHLFALGQRFEQMSWRLLKSRIAPRTLR